MRAIDSSENEWRANSSVLSSSSWRRRSSTCMRVKAGSPTAGTL
jgi:hypothetical protein